MKNYFLWILLLGLVNGCASIKTHTPLSLTVEKFLLQQNEREKNLDSVSGLLQVRYSLRSNSISGSAKWVKFQDRSRFEVSDPMGRVRYWLLKEKNHTLAFYETEKTAYSCEQDGLAYFRRFFQLPMSHEDTLKIWIGVLPRKWREQMEKKWENDRGFYEGKIQSGSEQVVIKVSDQNGLPAEIEWTYGGKKVQVSYSDYDACCTGPHGESTLGHSVTIKLPDASEKIELEWEELNVLEQAPNPLAWSRKVPHGTRVIRLNQ